MSSPLPATTNELRIQRRPTIQLLMPMGGLGTRFADVGIPTPKPLIPLDINGGEAMVLKAVSSFEELFPKGSISSSTAAAAIAVRVIFVVREEHEVRYSLRTQLLKVFKVKYGGGREGSFRSYVQYRDGPSDVQVRTLLDGDGSTDNDTEGGGLTADVEVVFVMMHANTNGAAETCLLAKEVTLPAAPLVILDCDLYVRSQLYNRFLRALAHRSFPSEVLSADQPSIPTQLVDNVLGLLVYFNSVAPRYSYAIVEPLPELEHLTLPSSNQCSPTPVLPATGGRVVRTAEKVPISNCALIGAYTFARGDYFIKGATMLLQQPINPANGLKEYYISLVFNFLLQEAFLEGVESKGGGVVVAVPKDEYHSFGTPEELATYNTGKASYVVE